MNSRSPYLIGLGWRLALVLVIVYLGEEVAMQ